jgi:hypothetical protein
VGLQQLYGIEPGALGKDDAQMQIYVSRIFIQTCITYFKWRFRDNIRSGKYSILKQCCNMIYLEKKTITDAFERFIIESTYKMIQGLDKATSYCVCKTMIGTRYNVNLYSPSR